MSQEQKKHNVYDLRAVLEAIELDLIQNLRRNMKRHEKEEEKERFQWEMWQKAKLRNIWKYRKQNQEIVGQRSKEIENLINKTLQESFDTAESMMEKLFHKIKSLFTRRGMKFPKDISDRGLKKAARSEEDFFAVNEKKINALQETAQEPQKSPEEAETKAMEPVKAREEITGDAEELFKPAGEEKDLSGKNNDQKLDDLKKQVAQDMKEIQGAIWRRMDDIYRQTIYKAEMFMAAGTKTLDQAIDLATKEFLDGGIDCIEYRNGRRVNIASYAEMALRTASQRATFLAEGKKRDEWGIHTIFVSAHANTCPKCEPWQGKVLVDNVFSHGTVAEAAELGVPLLSTAMKAGLLHPNCRHTLATYFPGITVLPMVPDKDKALKTYEAEQKQRTLERKIRKAKRKAAGACDQENVDAALTEMEELQKRMQHHLDQHPELRREYNREKTRGIPEQKVSGHALGESGSIKQVHVMKQQNIEQQVNEIGKLAGESKEKADYLVKDHMPGVNTTRERIVANEAISVVPEKVQRKIHSGTIVDVGQIGASQYDYQRDILYVAKGAEKEDIIHEIGHMVENRMMDSKKISQIRKKIIGEVDIWDIKTETYYDNEGNPIDIFLLQNDRFVSPYQGRIYAATVWDAFDSDGNFRDELMMEFVSEPFREYIADPEMLKSKCRELYDLIEGAVK